MKNLISSFQKSFARAAIRRLFAAGLCICIVINIFNFVCYFCSRIGGIDSNAVVSVCEESDLCGIWKIEYPMFYLSGNESKKGWGKTRLAINSDGTFTITSLNKDLWEIMDLYNQRLTGKDIPYPDTISGIWKLVRAEASTYDADKGNIKIIYYNLYLESDGNIFCGRKIIIKHNNELKINWGKRGTGILSLGIRFQKIRR